jgi:hypothetical protein
LKDDFRRYLKTIDSLQQTLLQNKDASAILSDRDRLRTAYQESNDHASALNIKVTRLEHANAQLKLQLDALTRESPSPTRAFSSNTTASLEKSRSLSIENQVLKRELADVRASGSRSSLAAGDCQDSRGSHGPPAFFITERQYSLLVEENSQLMQTNSALEKHVETLKQQLASSIRSQNEREKQSDEMGHFTLDALCEFCVGLGQRLDKIEVFIMQQLRSNSQ